MIGTRLGPYEIIEEIGLGGMATVYQAYQPRMDRHVALKVIRPAVIEDELVRGRFQREARVIARLEHPHILPVYDFDSSHEPPYIVMRYLEGGTLEDAFSDGPIPLQEVLFLLNQVGPALDYAHRQGVIHRDIKPSNILIDREGNAFVTDFGIARITAGAMVDSAITGGGVTLGTPDYMSPEQIMGMETVDHRADIYSLAVMVFQLITGRLPFVGDARMATLLKHLRDPAPAPTLVNPELPLEIDEVLLRALAKDPEDRPASVQEFTHEVTRVLGGLGGVVPAYLRRAAETALDHRKRRPVTQPVHRSYTASKPTEQNKTITVVYANAAEYAALANLSLGPEAARHKVEELWTDATRYIDEGSGLVINLNERDLLAVWGAALAREDDPEQAVRASLAIRDSLAEHAADLIPAGEPLPIRIGVNTGPVLLTVSEPSGDYSATGATISLASRVAGIADGLVLITRDTFREVQGIFEIEPDAPVRARRPGGRSLVETYRVLAGKPRAFRIQIRGVEGVATRMVGHLAELEVLQKAYINTVEESESQIVTVTGDPGLGKSRLLSEFAIWSELRSEMYFIFRGRATPAMTMRPYALWRDLLSFRFQIQDSDSSKVVKEKMERGVAGLIGENQELAHLIGHLVGFELTGSPYLGGEPQEVADRGRSAVGAFLGQLAAVDPVVFQIEDVHLADEASLDLIIELHRSLPKSKLMVVCMARPELLQRRPSWGVGQENHTRVHMRPLDKRDSRDLVAEILQKVDDLPRDLRDLIVEQSEGNPYYMEELVKMLIEDRVIQKLDERHWTVERSRVGRLRVPRTLVGLLQARFDSLLYPEQVVLQRATVVGRVFQDDALVALDAADGNHIDNLEDILEGLVAREFIYEREVPAFAGSREFIFGQAMMRDLIKETLLQRQLCTYSLAAAEWLTAQGGERSTEFNALIAEYYEQAGELVQAGEYFRRAGNDAVGRGALFEGQRLLEHGLSLLNPLKNEAESMRLQVALGNLYSWMGDYRQANDSLLAALASSRRMNDRRLEANVLAQLGRVTGLWLGDYDKAQRELEAASAIARELDDRRTLIFTLRQLGNQASATGAHAEAKNFLEESLRLAREEEDVGDAANALNSLGENARNQGDYEEAIFFYDQVLEVLGSQPFPSVRAMVAVNKGTVHLEQDDFVLAWTVGLATLPAVTELGTDYLIGNCLRILGGAAVGLGDLNAARGYLAKALRLYRQMGNLPGALITLAEIARLRAKDSDTLEAVTWLGMALVHPALSADGRLRISHVLDELRTGLPLTDVDLALAQGGELEVELVLTQADEWILDQ